MRPRIEGLEEVRLIAILDCMGNSVSPTELIKELINTRYNTLYPRGEVKNGNTEAREERRS